MAHEEIIKQLKEIIDQLDTTVTTTKTSSAGWVIIINKHLDKLDKLLETLKTNKA